MMYNNLFIQRRENRLTQEQVAKAIGMTKQTYCSKESGKRDFTLKEAKLLAKLFKKTLDDLFGH